MDLVCQVNGFRNQGRDRIKELETALATTEAAYRREKERADRLAEELAWHHNKLTFTYE